MLLEDRRNYLRNLVDCIDGVESSTSTPIAQSVVTIAQYAKLLEQAMSGVAVDASKVAAGAVSSGQNRWAQDAVWCHLCKYSLLLLEVRHYFPIALFIASLKLNTTLYRTAIRSQHPHVDV